MDDLLTAPALRPTLAPVLRPSLLLSDPQVAAVPVHETGEPLVVLDAGFGSARAAVRTGLADRLLEARAALPAGVHLRVVEGHRTVDDQRAIIARYGAELRALHPTASPDELHHLTSRYVAPVEVAPHVAGAAVDLTLVGSDGVDLDLGSALDATPEESAGACYLAAPVGRVARAHRDVLTAVLGGVGLVNYPTEWWHWSYGDRYWALLTGAASAPYGPVDGRAA